MNSQSQKALELVDYMVSRFNSMHSNHDKNMCDFLDRNHGYLLEKLGFISKAIDQNFGGELKNFIKAIEKHNVFSEESSMKDLKRMELTG